MRELATFAAKNGEEVTLRPAVPDDASGILDTVRSVSLERSYVLMEKYGKDEEAERRHISQMDRDTSLLIVAEVNGVIVGSLAAVQSENGQNPQIAHVLDVGLHLIQSYRGLGIGSRMLNFAVEWAREHGFKKLEASIFTINQRSLSLFHNAGFQEEGTRRKQFRLGNEYIEEVIMGMVIT